MLILVLTSLIYPSIGRTGYEINVIVNNSTSYSDWSWSQSTNQLDFSMQGSVRGDGNSSVYKSIQGFSGIGLKDNTYTKKGRLIKSDNLALSSRVNWIYIDEAVTNKSERYSVKINESIPVVLLEKSDIRYRGDGIYSRSNYVNNEDKIYTNYQANKFSKTTTLLSRYLNANIIADVTPVSVNEFIGRNFSTNFALSSESDKYARIAFKSDKENIDNVYLGSLTISNRISILHKFSKVEGENEEWLDCCALYSDALNDSNLYNQAPIRFKPLNE